MKFREQRGGLSDSMKTEIEVHSIEDLKARLRHISSPFGKSIVEIKFDYVGFDDRNKWDTYYVLQRLECEPYFTVAGMSDGILET